MISIISNFSVLLMDRTSIEIVSTPLNSVTMFCMSVNTDIAEFFSDKSKPGPAF